MVLPLVPLVFLMGTCVWVVIDETNQPPRMIDGEPDDAPTFAAAISLFILPVFYGIYLLALGAAWFIVGLIRRSTRDRE